MVELAALQAISYVMGSLGVFVAALYYIINLRYNMKAREMEIAQLFVKEWTSEQGMQRYAKMMTLEWTDYDDFMKKYGYSNPEMFGLWVSQLFMIETMGILMKSGAVSPEKIYYLGGYGGIRMWEKYKDIVAGRRGISWGHDYMTNAEYLANECKKIKLKHDVSFDEKLENYRKTGSL